MTPQEFIRKWKPVALTERATAHEHFLDLCRLFVGGSKGWMVIQAPLPSLEAEAAVVEFVAASTRQRARSTGLASDGDRPIAVIPLTKPCGVC